jgi:hypothetical protein
VVGMGHFFGARAEVQDREYRRAENQDEPNGDWPELAPNYPCNGNCCSRQRQSRADPESKSRHSASPMLKLRPPVPKTTMRQSPLYSATLRSAGLVKRERLPVSLSER